MQEQRPIIFFDGICHLCNGFVDFTLRRDLKHHFQFASLQGETAAKLLTNQERSELASVVLLMNEHKFQRSTAVLKVLIELGGFYRLLTPMLLLPPWFRDGLYNWIAKNRYSWFGQREVCRLPTPAEKDRLLP